MNLKEEKQVQVAQAQARPVQVSRPQERSEAAQASRTPPTPDKPEPGAQELETRLRAEFAETLRMERERTGKQQQQTLEVLRRERAEAAAAIALTRAGARNLKAARAMLTVDPAGFDGAEGAQAFADGLQAQIDALKAGADTGFLFAAPAPAFCGFVPAEGRDEPLGDAAAPMSLSDAVRRALSPGV